MAKRERHPQVSVKFINGTPKVYIIGFEKLNPAMIERGLLAAQIEWQRLRSKAIHSKKAKAAKMTKQKEEANA